MYKVRSVVLYGSLHVFSHSVPVFSSTRLPLCIYVLIVTLSLLSEPRYLPRPLGSLCSTDDRLDPSLPKSLLH